MPKVVVKDAWDVIEVEKRATVATKGETLYHVPICEPDLLTWQMVAAMPGKPDGTSEIVNRVTVRAGKNPLVLPATANNRI
jgi:hypothetical protein